MKKIYRLLWASIIILFVLLEGFSQFFLENPAMGFFVGLLLGLIICFLIISLYINWFKTKFFNLFWKILWAIGLLFNPFLLTSVFYYMVALALYYIIVYEFKLTVLKYK